MKNILLKWWYFFLYKPDSKDIYWEKIISSTVVVIGFGIFVLFNNKRVDKLIIERNQYARFTIGFVLGTTITKSGHDIVDYKYKYEGILYKKDDSWIGSSFNLPNIGSRYYVQYASNNPSNAEMLFQYPIPDSLQEVPDSGWVNMPGYK